MVSVEGMRREDELETVNGSVLSVLYCQKFVA